MKVHVTSTLRWLESDMKDIAKRSDREMRSTVHDGLKAGNRVARDSAKRTAGAHGKHYHKAFTVEMHPGGMGHYSGEYGPDESMPQGGMSFERGSRNQPPHLDLAKSADAIQAAFPRKVSKLVDGWFW